MNTMHLPHISSSQSSRDVNRGLFRDRDIEGRYTRDVH